MKTASFPSLRVKPDLRHAAESVLQDGESLSSFVEQSIRATIDRRRMKNEFIARGLASRDEAKLSGEYFSSDAIRAELDAMLNEAISKADTGE